MYRKDGKGHTHLHAAIWIHQQDTAAATATTVTTTIITATIAIATTARGDLRARDV